MNSSMWQMFSTNTPQKTSKAQRLSMKLPTPFEIMMWKEEKEKKNNINYEHTENARRLSVHKRIE